MHQGCWSLPEPLIAISTVSSLSMVSTFPLEIFDTHRNTHMCKMETGQSSVYSIMCLTFHILDAVIIVYCQVLHISLTLYTHHLILIKKPPKGCKGGIIQFRCLSVFRSRNAASGALILLNCETNNGNSFLETLSLRSEGQQQFGHDLLFMSKYVLYLNIMAKLSTKKEFPYALSCASCVFYSSKVLQTEP